jgi:hypothetical protein
MAWGRSPEYAVFSNFDLAVGCSSFLRGTFRKVPLKLPSKLFKPFGLWLNSFEGLLSMREAPAEAGPKSRLAPARGCGAQLQTPIYITTTSQ